MICVNPASVTAPDRSVFLQTLMPQKGPLGTIDGVTTPFVLYRDLYSARCAYDGAYHYLEITQAADPGGLRKPPMDITGWTWGTRMGTHVGDIQFSQGDLIEMIRARLPAAERD